MGKTGLLHSETTAVRSHNTNMGVIPLRAEKEMHLPAEHKYAAHPLKILATSKSSLSEPNPSYHNTHVIGSQIKQELPRS